jgi:hypothetical protein
MAAVGGVTALGGLMGTGQLVGGVATPPAADLPPGLNSWVIPGLWLFASVAAPWTVATGLVWLRSAAAPKAVLLASASLAVELAVQLPFLGPSVLQAVFAAVAVGMTLLAADARRHAPATAEGHDSSHGRRHRGAPDHRGYRAADPAPGRPNAGGSR